MNKNLLKKTFSWFLIDFLHKRHDFKSAFLMTGGGVFHICNALSDHQEFIKSTFFYHEQQAAFAAEGFSKLTNKISLVIGTSGPGATNLITGIVSAYQDSVPLLAITGQCKSNDYKYYQKFEGLRQAGTFDNDFSEFSKNYTKKVFKIDDPNTGILKIEEAINIAYSGRPGPVIVEIPLDIQGALIDKKIFQNQINKISKINEKKISKNHLNSSIKNQVLKKIVNSNRISILAGRGCTITSTWEDVYKICEKFNIPLVTTYPAKDENLSNLSWWCGVVGLKGSYSGNSVLNESDLVISLGNSLHQQTVGWDLEIFLENKNIIYVDIDEVLCNKFSQHNQILTVNLDLVLFLSLLSDCLYETKSSSIDYLKKWSSSWQKYRSKESIINTGIKFNKGFSLYDLINKFNKFSSKDSVIVADSGTTWYVTGQTLILKSGQSFITNSAMGSMGFALPASIGISFNTSRHTYCLVGDGSFMTALSSLWTIKRENLPITIIIINNVGYNSISNTQERFGGADYFGSTYESGLADLNIKLIAEACSIKYLPIHNLDQLTFEALEKKDEPILLDVFIDKKTTVVPFVKSILQSDGTFRSGSLNNLEPKE